jgi:uncharacterized protein YaaN involved in tellurite resistance
MTDILGQELSLTAQKAHLFAPGLAADFPARFKAAQALLPRLDFSQSSAVLAFGLQQQGQHLAFTEATVQHVQAGKNFALHQLVLVLSLKGLLRALEVERCHCQEQRPWAVFLGRMPLVGSWLAAQVHSGQALMRRFVRSKIQISKRLQELDEGVRQVLQHSNFLERLEQQQREQVHQLEVFIVAGELKQAAMEEDFFLHQQALAAQNGVDPKELEDWHRFGLCIQAVDIRLHNLKESHAAAAAFGPALHKVQQEALHRATRLQESLGLFPAWQKQMLLFIAHLDLSLARRLGLALGEQSHDLQETLVGLRRMTRDLLHSLEQGGDMEPSQEECLEALVSLQEPLQQAHEALRPESA